MPEACRWQVAALEWIQSLRFLLLIQDLPITAKDGKGEHKKPEC